ncbi:M28 family peptidase [bacterium]|nr:M28 family peptidase [bacterium]
MGRAHLLVFALTILTGVFNVSSCTSTVMPEYDGTKAYADLERQVAFGPRVPGSEAHEKTKNWLIESLKSCTSYVAVQPFRDRFAGQDTDMYNIMASFYPDKKQRILLCAHWDCRPYADQDKELSNHSKPVPGANDSASGVAVLLGIARIMKDNEPPVGVDIVFFDGEDGGDYGDDDTWTLGSRFFAKTMPSSFKPQYAVLLDMIGDKDLSLTRDYYSAQSAPLIMSRIEKICGNLGISMSPGMTGITDDHIPLIGRGIPSVDLIDFDYPSWHTVSDTPDKCSAESLGKIGTLVLTLIYGE